MNIIKRINVFLFSKKALPILVCVMSIGLIISVFSNIYSYDDIETSKEEKNVTELINQEYTCNSTISYTDAENLERILSCIKNVDDVSVQFVYKTTSEKIPMKLTDDKGNETTVMESENSKTTPFIIKEKYPKIEGVIIVADYGDDITLKNEIITAVSDVYDIPIHKVKIFKKKNI